MENNNNVENEKVYSYKDTMELGIDTTSVTTSLGEGYSPFMLNLISKEGSGIKRRDGLLETDTSSFLDNDDKILGSCSIGRNIVFLIIKDHTGKFQLINYNRKSTSFFPLYSKIELPSTFPILASGNKIRFNVIINFPSITNNIFVYGFFGHEYIPTPAFPIFSFFNLAGIVKKIGDIIEIDTIDVNNVLKSTKVAGVLNIVDHEIVGKRFLALVYDNDNKLFRLLFGAGESVELDDFYEIPSMSIATGLVSQRGNAFILTKDAVYIFSFNKTTNSVTTFSKYINNFGCKHPWAYSVVNTDCYMLGESSFFKMSMKIEKSKQPTVDISEPIDDFISNMYPYFNPYITIYRWDEKTIYFFGNFKNDFVEYSIYLWYKNIKNYRESYENFRDNIEYETRFALCYNIVKKSWFLQYWDLEIISASSQYVTIDSINEELISEFSYFTKNKILLNNKSLYMDGNEDFLVEFMPRIINQQELTGYQILIERIMVLFSNNRKDNVLSGYNAMVSSVILNENITRVSKDAIFNTSKSPLNSLNDISLKVSSNLVSTAPNHLICLNSRYVDIIKGVVINVRKSGNITK